MCGVAGLFAYHYASPGVSREELIGIRDFMEKRGPDGSGAWFSADHRVGLGHRRLSIIDLSENGAQPMMSSDGNAVISFNGEIYNYKELRLNLQARGVVFRSNSDTEVLLHLYLQEGEKMFEKLRGMFAFALWDAQKKALLLARDPYGIKPLYYADDGWIVKVASQVKALVEAGRVSRQKEPAGIAGFFLMGSVPEPFTIYQEIRSVPAGSYLWVNELGPQRPVSYFSIAQVFSNNKYKEKKPELPEAQHAVRSALLESVRYHFVSDVPVGIFLSAGIDSSVLTALAREIGIQDLQTITASFSDFIGTDQDESIGAGEIARIYGTRHVKHLFTQEMMDAELEKALGAMDQPSIDGVNSFFVSKIAAELGLKVVLSGLGGDELFGSYPSFVDIPRWKKIAQWPSKLPGLGLAQRAITRQFFSGKRSPKLASFLEYAGTDQGAYFLKRGLFMPWELPMVMNKEMAEEGIKRLNLLARIKSTLEPLPPTDYARIGCLESSFYLRNQLLRDADWAGMAHSIEIRVPWVDVQLLKDIAPLLECTGKNIRRKSLMAQSPSSSLPNSVVARRKTGFAVPMEKNLESGKNRQSWRRIPILSAPTTHWSRRWAQVVSERFFSV